MFNLKRKIDYQYKHADSNLPDTKACNLVDIIKYKIISKNNKKIYQQQERGNSKKLSYCQYIFCYSLKRFSINDKLKPNQRNPIF
jgi:hypothetical protein